MIKINIVFLVTMIFSSALFAVQKYTQKIDNTELTVGTWEAKIKGSIKNEDSNIDFINTLGYGSPNNITLLQLNIDNNSNILPDIKFNAFILKQSIVKNLTSAIVVDDVNLSNAISTDIQYMTVDTLLYGYEEREDFKFKMGANIKYINFKEELKETASGGSKATTKTKSFILLPYVGFDYKIDFLSTIIKADVSSLSIGDIQVNDYSYSIEYYIMKNMTISYGYKEDNFKIKDGDDKIEYIIYGNFLTFNLRF